MLERFQRALHARLPCASFGLALHPEKDAADIRVRAVPARKRRVRGERAAAARRPSISSASRTSAGRPGTGASGSGASRSRSGWRAKLREVKAELRRRRHRPVPEQGQMAGQAWCAGTAPTTPCPATSRRCRAFRDQVGAGYWYRALRRRSQRTPPDLGADGPPRRPVAASMPGSGIPGRACGSTPVPKAGAQCGSSARWDLSGAAREGGPYRDFTPASPVRLDNGDRPGPGQLARRRGGPRREHPRHRRHRPLARSSAGLWLRVSPPASPQHQIGVLGVTEGSLSLALVATGLGTGQALAAVLLYRFTSFWLVALAGWLIVFWLRHPRAHRGPGPSRRTAHEQDATMAANLRTTDTPARLGAHELVLADPKDAVVPLETGPPPNSGPAGCSPPACRGRGS